MELLCLPLMLLTSYWYFRSSPASTSLPLRLLISAHGLVASLLFIGALLIGFSGRHADGHVAIFLGLQALPLLLIVLSLLLFRGPREIHWLQVLNVAGILWAGFLGTMLVGGEWL